MAIKVCVAGATGFVGSLITRRILESKDFQLVGAVARKKAGEDIGEAIGLPRTGIRIADSVEEALKVPAEVLIDYTHPQAVK
ncbi:MAG: 4-hydroxy-tetrahydrodipicolinate reductase, partial [bacterium]